MANVEVRLDSYSKITRICYDRVEFHELLCEFSREVERKKYHKIEYNLWRNLYKWDTDIDIEYNDRNNYIYLVDSVDDTWISQFDLDDKSFGSFLNDIFIREREKAMDIGTYSTATNSSVSAAEKSQYSSNIDLNLSSSISNINDTYTYDTYTWSGSDWNTIKPGDWNSTAVGTISLSEDVAMKADISEVNDEIGKIREKIDQMREELDRRRDDVDYLTNDKANVADMCHLFNEIEIIQNAICDLETRINNDAVKYYELNDLRDELYRMKTTLDCQIALICNAIIDERVDPAVCEAKADIKALEEAYATCMNLIKNVRDKDIIFKKPTFDGFKKNTIYNIKNNNSITIKENEKMKNFVNFDFGPCTGDNVRMSMYGLAVKNVSGTWVSYDVANHAIMDVDIFNFDGAKFLYKMPVAIKDVKAGDCIIHSRKPLFVTKVGEKSVWAVDPVEGENKEIMLTVSPFGFNFVTKVVNFMDGMTGSSASADCPFGNMWMLMMMEGGETDMSDMLLPMMMMNGGNMGNMNPMMMYMLMGDKGDVKDMLPWMLMMNSMGTAAGTTAQ